VQLYNTKLTVKHKYTTVIYAVINTIMKIMYIRYDNFLTMHINMHIFYPYTWLGSVVVGRRTCDREIAGSTPGRCTAG